MADIIKSTLTWILGSLFVLLMFPVTLILWLIFYPTKLSSSLVHRWVTFQGIVLVRLIPLWKIRIERGSLDCKGPFVVIANHQSLLDIPFLHLLNCNFRWVSKIENFNTPLLGVTMRMAGYIEVERGNPDSVAEMMKKAEKTLRDGISLIIFPEGTRSRNGEVGKFKPGAFRLALNTGTPLLPVIIDGTSKVLPKKGILFSSGHPVSLKVMDPVMPEDFASDDPELLAGWFQEYFKGALDAIRIKGL